MSRRVVVHHRRIEILPGYINTVLSASKLCLYVYESLARTKFRPCLLKTEQSPNCSTKTICRINDLLPLFWSSIPTGPCGRLLLSVYQPGICFGDLAENFLFLHACGLRRRH